MDIMKYKELKKSGASNLFKVGPATVAYSKPTFDKDTGREGPAEIEQFNLVGVDEVISIKEMELANLKEFREDMKALLK
ncbi:MAG: hypothetical protein ACYC36_03815 [Bellilinea sp.]